MDTKQKIIISVLMLGTLMGSLDSTIVILAFPTISDSLHASFIATLWVILIYLLVVAVCTTQLGRIGDIYGRSRMFNAGFGIFTVGSLFCGLSPAIDWLIASRVIQGVGGALMQANSGAIIADSFPPNTRGTAFGYLSLGWTSGAMLGIVLGGIITTYVGWEYIFFINVPIGIVATILGVRYLTDNPRVHAKLDLTGMILLGAALTFLSFAGVDFATEGTALTNIVTFCLGLALIALFVMFERRTSRPIIDFSALRNRILRYSMMAAFFLSLGYLSVVFLITMYLQGIRALSPLDAALLLTPGYVVGSLLSPYMGKLSDRYGARVRDLRHRDADPCHARLCDVSGRYPTLGGSGRIGHLRPRDGDVLPVQQQCGHGKRPAGVLWRDIRHPPDRAEYRGPGKFRHCHHGIGSFNTPGCGVRGLHRHYQPRGRGLECIHQRDRCRPPRVGHHYRDRRGAVLDAGPRDTGVGT